MNQNPFAKHVDAYIVKEVCEWKEKYASEMTPEDPHKKDESARRTF